MHHSCELTQRCAPFYDWCTTTRATNGNNFGRQVLPLTTVQVLATDPTIQSHKTNAIHRATEATARAICQIRDRKLF